MGDPAEVGATPRSTSSRSVVMMTGGVVGLGMIA